MPAPDVIAISVAYAGPDDQAVVSLNVSSGTTLRAAIERSRIMSRFPEIELSHNRVGVFGQLRDLGDMVAAGDRVEIYRPLAIDPKEARSKRKQLLGTTAPV
jgi:putative ubiquitin-RnfH superfamily antitoxin RatB of RatAB toxin-antitoxin module